MPRSVALLRGINVGRNHQLPMGPLRDVFVDAGFTDVETYIRSGNVVFGHPRTAEADLTADLEKRIAKVAGFAVPVILRSAAQLAAVVEQNPYPGVEATKLHIVFRKEPPAPDAFAKLDLPSFAPEELTVVGRELYLHLPDGMGRAKLPAALARIAAARGTARNWRTTLKLLELAS